MPLYIWSRSIHKILWFFTRLFLPNLIPQASISLVLNLQSRIHTDLSTFHNVILHVITSSWFNSSLLVSKTISAHMGPSQIFQTIWDHLQSSGSISDYLFTIFYHLRPSETILANLGLSGTISILSPSGTISLQLGPSNFVWDHLRLYFEGIINCHIVPQPDFLWLHIHMIILIQFVSNVHIGCRNS